MSSFGEVMKRERELRQITLREISEATKINLRYLDALERNDFRHLPGGVFNKGFVRAYAQHIGVDPETMVTAYLEEEQGQQARSEERQREVLRRNASAEPTIGKPLPSVADPKARSRRWFLTGAVTLLVVLISLAGYAMFRNWHRVERLFGGSEKPVAASGTVTSATTPPVSSPAGETRNRAIPVKLVIVRQTTGTLNCDDRERKSFDGLPAGAEINMSCLTFLVIDTQDAGAVRLGIDGAMPETLGPDGQPVRAHRIEALVSRPNASRPAP